LKRIIDGFLSVFGLMSRIPVRSAVKPEPVYAALFIPLVGVAAGLLVAGVYLLCRLILDDNMLIVLIVLPVQYIAFNLFHFDGFLDTMDAAFVFASREKRLAILKDVHIGAYAVFFGVLYLAGKVVLLSRAMELCKFEPSAVFLLFCYPVAGRTAASLQAWCQAPARSNGLSAGIGRFAALPTLAGAVLGILPAALAAVWLPAPLELYAAFCSIPVALVIGVSLYRRIAGGITGDGLGFSVETGELLYLFLFYGAAMVRRSVLSA
jgi:adenosylcobinamide-GDP ribazoletransferase